MMVAVLRRGSQDFIGAARPSIADPFLPRKIEEGRIDDIRECIGCNICTTGYMLKAPSRCTQNPTLGEEWRRDWHPERVPPAKSGARILVVGAGPAGLECAHILGKRGYEVVLAEAGKTLGGRVTLESRLPGLAEWARVRDYRLLQLGKLHNVSIYPDNRLTASAVREFGFEHVVIATGASWRTDGFGKTHPEGIKGSDQPSVFAPDHILQQETLPEGPVVVIDDDYYYMASVIADKLRAEKRTVYFVTAAAEPAPFTHFTNEQRNTLKGLYGPGMQVFPMHSVQEVTEQEVTVTHVHTRVVTKIPCAAVVMVTTRTPNDALYQELVEDEKALQDSGILSVRSIGDCYIPSTIASAVWWGHRYARELDSETKSTELFRRERSVIFSE
jgi:dimethylamine/trimethylamine dehydrogenase